VQDIADFMGMGLGRTGAILARAGIVVYEDDTVDKNKLLWRLTRLLEYAEGQTSTNERGVNTVLNARSKIINKLESVGLKVVKRRGKGGVFMTIRRENGSCFELLTYTSYSKKKNGQYGFSGRWLKNREVEWVLFYIAPLDRTYLKRPREFPKKLRDGQISYAGFRGVSYSAGSAYCDLWENRIEEMKQGFPIGIYGMD
jgi:hypothetical protein